MIREEVVVLIRRDKLYKPFRLRKGRKVSYDRLSFYPDGALGHPYGSCFAVHGHQLVRSGQQLESKEHESGVDNRGIFDDSSSQKLTEQDISEMRQQGASGQEIVESMIEHSATFKEKTRYSQQKYIKKKEKKHVPVLTIIQPSTRMLCEMYYARGPSKICHLRVDTLAQIVTYSNAHAHSHLLLLETCQGLLAGALLERMGGFGKLVQVFFGDFPVRLALENFSHLSDGDQSVLLEYPLHRVGSLLHSQQPTPVVVDSCSEGPYKDVVGRPGLEPHGERVGEPGTEPCGDTVGMELGTGDSGDEARSCTVSVEPDVEPYGDRDRDERLLKSSTETHGDTESGIGAESMDLDSGDGLTPCGHSGAAPLPEAADPQEPASKQPAPGVDPDSEPSGRGHLAEGSEVKEEDGGARSADGTQDEHDAEWGRLWEGRRPKRKWQQSEGGTLKREKRKKEKEERFKLAEEVLRQKQMDGLIITSRFHPEPVLMTLIEFVAPSRPIVVYCHIIEPLVQCYNSLKDAGVAFNIQITESWLRHYQMLPERTHPEMKMDARSGYLLTATTVKRTD